MYVFVPLYTRWSSVGPYSTPSCERLSEARDVFRLNAKPHDRGRVQAFVWVMTDVVDLRRVDCLCKELAAHPRVRLPGNFNVSLQQIPRLCTIDGASRGRLLGPRSPPRAVSDP